jgi:hypothetical protein
MIEARHFGVAAMGREVSPPTDCNARALVAALLACAALAACAKGDQESTGGRTPTPSSGSGTGATSGTGAGGTTGFGTPGMSGMPGDPMMMMNNPPPLVDAMAPPYMQDDTGMSGLDPKVIEELKKGGGACAADIIYPYQGTVFPGGLQPPIIMWPGPAEAAYVHMAYDGSKAVEYEFATGMIDPGRIQIPQAAWNEVTRRTNNAKLLVTVNVKAGGAVTTCETWWKIAAGNMVGAVYYNTYQAPGSTNPNTGAVMRLTLGAATEIYKEFKGPVNFLSSDLGPCYSCHSVSFDGSTLVASFHDYAAKAFRVENFNVTMAVDPPVNGMVHNANFGALTRDGARILAMGNPDCTGGADTFPRATNNFMLVEGPAVARVLDTATGNDTNATGLNPEHYMWMPQFSPDGDKVVFNHAKPDGAGGTDRYELAIMDYDGATNTFSNLKVIGTGLGPKGSMNYSPATAMGGVVPCGEGGCPSGGACVPGPVLIPGNVAPITNGSCAEPCYPAWPFVTPDGRAVVFALISEPDFASAFPGRETPAKSELWYVDLDTLETVKLENANTGSAPEDLLANYYPTVMPVTIGGYFWVYWTARRDYGHILDAAVSGDSRKDAISKRIWAAAIKPKADMGGDVMAAGPLKDPSFPGFYVEGQTESGNIRSFATLNPCLDNGAACSSGLDCCCGYCVMAPGDPQGMCSCEVPTCAKKNEKCTDHSDCCPPTNPDEPQNRCIAGFCNFIVPE